MPPTSGIRSKIGQDDSVAFLDSAPDAFLAPGAGVHLELVILQDAPDTVQNNLFVIDHQYPLFVHFRSPL